MKKSRLLVALPCMLALMFALVGCSGGGAAQSSEQSEAESKAAFSGVWDLVRSNDGSRVVEQNELDQLRERGLNVFLQLDESGTAWLDLFGDERAGSWTPKTATEATLTFEGEDIPMKIEEGTLSMTEDVNQLDFQKREDEEEAAEDEAAADEIVFEQQEAMEALTIADTDQLTITVDGKAATADGLGFTASVTNKADYAISVTADEGGFQAGEQEIPMTGAYSIEPGVTTQCYFWAAKDQLPSQELGDLQNVQGLLTVTNQGTQEVLGTFTVQF